MKTYEVKQSDNGIVPNESGEQRGGNPGGAAGGKDVNQRESARPSHRRRSGYGMLYLSRPPACMRTAASEVALR